MSLFKIDKVYDRVGAAAAFIFVIAWCLLLTPAIILIGAFYGAYLSVVYEWWFPAIDLLKWIVGKHKE